MPSVLTNQPARHSRWSTLLTLAVVALAAPPSLEAERRLLGVDDDGERAYVIDRGGGWSLSTIAVDDRRIVESWEATVDNRDALNGTHALIRWSPIDSSLEADLVRFAAIVARTAPASRAHTVNGQRTATGHVYQLDAALVLTDRTGAEIATLAGRGGAKVSPDGTMVLWTTEHMNLAVARAAPKAAVTIASPRAYLAGAQWSVDGKAIYAASRDDHCLYRFALPKLRGKRLYCSPGLAGFAQDPTGATIAVAVRASRADTAHVVWLDARTGRRRTEQVVDADWSYAIEDYSLGPDGLFIALDERSHLIAVDLAKTACGDPVRRGNARRCEHPSPAWVGDAGPYEGVRATRWRDTTVVLLRDHVTLERIDVRRLIDEQRAE